MKIINTDYIKFFSLLLFLLPIVSFAAVTSNLASSTVINCSGSDCDFDNLMLLVEGVIDFILYGVATPFAAIMFAVAGWKMMTAGDNPSQVQEAKTIFKYVAIGFIVALSAWLLVSALLDGLQVKVGSGSDPDYNLLQ